MTIFRGHILPFLSIIMLAFLALPGSLEAKHAIFEHHTFVCKEKGKLHVHEIEMECEFHKYTISNFIFPEYVAVDDNSLTIKTVKVVDFYQFLNKYQKLHFSQRGPPSFA